MKAWIAAIGLSLLVMGCTEPTIDASSEDAFQQSSQALLEAQPEDKRQELGEALLMVTMAGLDFGTILQGQSDDAQFTDSLARLDGMTADNILAEAQEIRIRQEALARQRREQERSRLQEQIAELEADQQAAEEARSYLDRFIVQRAHYYISDGHYSYQREPIIELTVENRTGRPISRAFFHAVVGTPGRAVPWISEPFNYSIPGGLEPGETASWNLAPGRYTWGRVEVPDDVYIELTVQRLDGPDGETLWDARGLSESQQDHLARLRRRVEDL